MLKSNETAAAEAHFRASSTPTAARLEGCIERSSSRRLKPQPNCLPDSRRHSCAIIPPMKRLFPLVIFANAFLLFEVQPLLAKMIVPWFGGSAAVWTACLLFFQVLLLGGYLYAHWLAGLQPKMQGRIHTTLLGLSLLSLPIIPRIAWRPSGSEDPTFRILWVLTVTVGLPYFLLSSTSPLVQAWYARARPAGEPYRLYSLSNLGSMLALLSYPVVVEPLLTTRHQAFGWSIAYAGAGALCAALALRTVSPKSGAAKSEPAPESPTKPPPEPGWKTQWLWIALPACASVLLLAVTNHVCENVAAIPLLWIPPLALYLLSFILCFEGHAWYRRRLFVGLLALALGGMVYTLSPEFQNAGFAFLILLYMAGLFVCCMVCHGELARLKPHPAHLTRFYFLVSLGGALGGVFVALLAPRIFSGSYELPIALVGCPLLLLAAIYRDPTGVFPDSGGKAGWAMALLLVLALASSLSVSAWSLKQHSRLMERNFYGVVRVADSLAGFIRVRNGFAEPVQNQALVIRTLYNGTISHGFQFLAPGLRRAHTDCYAPSSGAGLALRLKGEQGPLRVGVIGLGTGTIASYSRAGDHFTFYEINPLVVEMARTQFTYLSDSPAQIDVLVGDGRLSLERQAPQGFDVLFVDAFASAAIPLHLLTREAFAVYFRHLKPDGILAVHISNWYLDLEPVAEPEAAYFGKPAIEIINAPDPPRGIRSAKWVLMTSDRSFLDLPEIRIAGVVMPAVSGLPLWTDDYTSMLSLLRWVRAAPYSLPWG